MNSGNDEPITSRTSPFESIRRQAEDGSEYWSARDLAKILGYNRWETFQKVISKAKVACTNSGHAVSDHFRDITKMIKAAKGAQREVEDFELSSYACDLIVQNADPSKAIIAVSKLILKSFRAALS